jgi:tetratricopeptide (TPR) repeat protein
MDRASNLNLLIYITLLLVLFLLLGLTPQFSLELLRTRQAVDMGDFLDASKHLAKAAQHLPWRKDLWESAGHYALQAGNPHDAIQYFEKGTLSLQGFLDLGDAYQQAGDLRSAVQSWQEATSSVGSSKEISQRLFQAHLVLADYSAATEDLQSLVALQPNDARLHFRLGLLLAATQPGQALEQFRQSSILEPDLAPIVGKIEPHLLEKPETNNPAYLILEIGRILAAAEHWELAVETFQQVTLIDPQFSEGWAYLGEARQHLPQATAGDGLPELQKALILDSGSIAGNTLLAFYWLRQDKFELAGQALRKSIQLDPQNPGLYVDLGNVLAASGDLNSAYEAFKEAIRMSPYDPQYLRYLVDFSLVYDYKLSEVALPYVRQVLILEPNNPQNLDMIAQVLIRLGDLASARRYLEQALQINPNHIPAHLHLGTIFMFQGDMTSAFRELTWVRSHAPNTALADQATRLLETYFPGVKLP